MSDYKPKHTIFDNEKFADERSIPGGLGLMTGISKETKNRNKHKINYENSSS